MRSQAFNHGLTKTVLSVAIGLTSLAAHNVYAHGYVTNPPSREFLCKTQKNLNCGPVTWEPQSMEYTPNVESQPPWGGSTAPFPQGGPGDGHFASGGLGRFFDVDAQSATRWSKTVVKPGPMKFHWYYTAIHRTAYWQFFMTKQGWNPNVPLSRDAFDTKPFCEERHDGSMPNGSSHESDHSCVIPSDRSGYHVILAAWKVGDTAATFYQVLDVDVQNSIAPSKYTNVGEIKSQLGDLLPRDSVKTRVFNAQGEVPAKSVTLQIDKPEQGKADVWPQLLAKKINNARKDYVAGQLDAKGTVRPQLGNNTIYAKKGSDITRVELDMSRTIVPTSISVSGLAPSYAIVNKQAAIDVTVSALGARFDVRAEVQNSANHAVATARTKIDNGSGSLHLAIDNAVPGTYQLVVIASAKNGEPKQQTLTFKLTGDSGKGDDTDKGQDDGGSDSASTDYEFVYPEGLGTYVAGTKVKGSDGDTYVCKAWPATAWCNSPSEMYYAPGKGLAWTDAWTKFTGENKAEQVDPANAPPHDFVYPEGRDSYVAGTRVLGKNGKVYVCKAWPYSEWCKSPSELYYSPGTGLAWSDAWTEVESD